MNTEKQGTQEVQVDEWKNLVYKEGTNVEMDGTLFYQLMLMIDEIRQKETKTEYLVVMKGKKEPKLEPQVFVSREGVALSNFLQEMIGLHIGNAKEGKAVPLSEIQQSAITLIDKPALTDLEGNELKSDK